MSKYIFLIICSFFFTRVFAQIGINTDSPAATLDVAANPGDTLVPAGVIAPRLSGETLLRKNALYGAAQTGCIVYVTSPSPRAGVAGEKTLNITRAGYYYYDGNFWQFLSSVEADNGLNSVQNQVRLGGAIVQPTIINGISSENFLSLQAQGVNSIGINRPLFSVDAANNRVGIGTISPQQTLDVQGTMRLNPLPPPNSGPDASPVNRPSTITQNGVPLSIDRTSGQLSLMPEGSPASSGGFRPAGLVSSIAVFPTDNTIARIRFVYHVDDGTDANNSVAESYTYGDLVLVGIGTANSIRFVESWIRGVAGPRELTVNTETEIAWVNGTGGTVSLVINQTTGELTLTHDQNISSFMFDILGGI